jgi:hypothetical protein
LVTKCRTGLWPCGSCGWRRLNVVRSDFARIQAQRWFDH